MVSAVVWNGDLRHACWATKSVLSALRDANFGVQATRHHMRTDRLHLLYSHFWSTGATVRLNGLPGALGRVDSAETGS